jgi:hypothetical protein
VGVLNAAVTFFSFKSSDSVVLLTLLGFHRKTSAIKVSKLAFLDIVAMIPKGWSG